MKLMADLHPAFIRLPGGNYVEGRSFADRFNWKQMIGPPEQTWMINFRVDDLDAMAEQLRRAGESVDIDPQRYPNGRFAEVSDPEGNRIQLWQPMAPA